MKKSFYIKNIILSAILIAFVLLITGCNIAPEYIDPETGKPISPAAQISLLKKSSIKTIFGTSKNVFYIMNNGQLLASGDNSNGLLGQGNTKQYSYVVDVKLPERIKLITATSKTAVAISDTNNIYVWGDLSWWGITDVKNPEDNSTSPMIYKKFHIEKEILTDISISNNHIAVLSKKGTVYTLGFDNGQLGYKDTPAKGDFYPEFEKVDSDIVYLNVSTNATTTYMLSADGEIYACGKNENNEMGYIDSLSYINKLDSIERFKSIQTAGHNLIALTESGDVYVCGKNEYGVLAVNNEYLENISTLTKVPFENEKVKEIYGSDETYSLHFFTESGNVYASGLNENNSLYTQNTNDKLYSPSLVKIGIVSSFYGFGKTRFYTDSRNYLYTYGSNQYCQMPNITSDNTDKFVLPVRIYASIK